MRGIGHRVRGREGRGAGLRWALLAGLLALLAFGVRAQTGHVHQWEALDNLPQSSLGVETDTPVTGQVVALSPPTAMSDLDTCLNTGGGGEPCSFWDNQAWNNVYPSAWSDGGAGGRFGYMDAYGQFTETADPWMVSHYECPALPGTVTLSVTQDDDPTASEPDTGLPVATHDDAAVAATATLTVSEPPVHQHAWNPQDDIPAPTLSVYTMGEVEAGHVVDLYTELQTDTDYCLNADFDCSFYYMGAPNQVVPLGWSDGGAGGQFGYYQGGTFVPAVEAAQVTHYRCPTFTEGTRLVELILTVDDVPSALDPATNETISTYDDQPASASTTLSVLAPHQHRWEAVDNLNPPSFTVDPSPATTGTVVQLQHYLGMWMDTDRCLPERCPFPESLADNSVRVTGWSDGGAGGTFGYQDGWGQFVEVTDPAELAWVTHYRCPDTPAAVQLSLTVDDDPMATDPVTGELVATYDDAAATATVALIVEGPPPHTHAWDPTDNLPQPQVWVAEGTPLAGVPVAVSVQTTADTDQCWEYGGEPYTGCPFPGGVAENGVRVTGWSDGGAGGGFGYLDDLGAFVASTDPTLVTHYLPAAGGGTVTLTVTVDDVPEAAEPGTGNLVATYDDASAQGYTYFTTYDGGGHGHQWEVGLPLGSPWLGVEAEAPEPGQVVQLALNLPEDWDECTQYDGCPLGNRADNPVRAMAWSDGGAGGEFGYLDELGAFVAAADPAAVTHYRCPTGAGAVTVTVTVDDLPETVDPASGQLIPTYDDGAASASRSLTVTVPDDHGHEWEPLDDLPAPIFDMTAAEVEPGGLIPVAVAAGNDDDLCIDPATLPCAFPDYVASNAVQVVAWSDGGAGGEFGYLDASGQFVSAPARAAAGPAGRSALGFVGSGDPALITHYRAPATPPVSGAVTLSVTVDDIPLAQETVSGYTVGTYNDAPASSSRTLAVAASSGGHQHDWDGTPISAGPLQVGNTQPAVGEIVSVQIQYGYYDQDFCVEYPSPPYTEVCPLGNYADNTVKITSWSDGGKGGQFGYMSGATFTPVTQPADYWKVQHYRCPTQAGTVTLTVRLDDEPWVILSGVQHATDNDPFVDRSATLLVSGGHGHKWQQVHDISPPSLYPSTSTPRGGDVVQLTATTYGDTDQCLTTTPACPFPSGRATNSVRKEAWSASVSGGQFGYYHNGSFVPTSSASQVTHYQCPTVASGTLTVRLTLTVNDLPSAVTPAGSLDTTFDDRTAARDCNLTVYPGSASHAHTWQAVHDIPAPVITTNTDNAASQELIGVWAALGEDSDTCLNTNPPCPFPGGNASNSLAGGAWSDGGAGGQFGYYNGSFVPTSIASQVTHYRCPTVNTGQVSVTLRRTIDDVPQATEPGGSSVGTFDDQEAGGTRTITVYAGHEHSWQAGQPIGAPTLDASPTQPKTGTYVALTATAGTDFDNCVNYVPACPFPNNTAENTVMWSWSDHNAGGAFGKWVNGQFQTCPANQVTHYRCPQNVAVATNVTLTLTLEDNPYAAEPGGRQVGTYNDPSVSVDRVIAVQPLHQHHWTSDGNHAARPVTLVYPGTETPATTVTPCALLEVRKGELSPDRDTCDVPDCTFPNGEAPETTSPAQTLRYATDGEGLFGTLDARGKFHPLAEDQIDQITHFQVGYYTGEEHVYFVLDDTGEAVEPETSHLIATYNDPPVNGPAHVLVVAGEKQRDCEPRTSRVLDESDICQCQCKVPAMSTLSPLTGAVGFDVPVTGWSYRGLTLDFSLSYSSNLRADPTLDVPHVDSDVLPQANLAHLASRHSGWTHNWAQFIEVVEDGAGESHALWHTGDGGVVTFDGNPAPSGFAMTWAPRDSYHQLTSDGIATTTVPLPRAFGGQQGQSFQVTVPYKEFKLTVTDGTVYEFKQIFWAKGHWVALPHFLLTRVVDRYGRAVQLHWQEDRLQKVVDGNGRGLTFQYAGKTLSSVTDPFQRVHRFAYANYTSEWGRPEAHLVETRVEGPGSPARVVHLWKFAYGTPTHDVVTWKREPNGKEVNYGYEGINYTADPPRPTPADWDGRMVQSTSYDAAEGVLKTLQRDGHSLIYPEGNKVTYQFADGFMTGIKDEATGRYVRYQYSTLGNLEKVWVGGMTGEEQLLAEIDYTLGTDPPKILSTTVTGPYSAEYGDKTVTDFGLWGLPNRVETGFRTTGGQGYNRLSLLKRDGLGNLLSAVVQGGNLSDTTTLGGYLDDQPTWVRDSVNRESRTDYDIATGLVKKSYSPNNPVPGAFDPLSSVSEVKYTQELPTQFTDPLGRHVYLSYTAQAANSPNLLVTVTRSTDPYSRTVLLNADGQPLEVTDELGVLTRYQYNSDGQVLRVTEAVGLPEQRTTQFRYNRNGDLVELTNPRGYSTHYSYQRFNQAGQETGPYEGQVTRIQYPGFDTSSEYFGYDEQTGELSWTMRPMRVGTSLAYQVVTYERDLLGRVTRVHYPASVQGHAGFTLGADYDEFGQVTRSLEPAGATEYTYDGLGRLRTVTPGDDRKALALSYIPDYGYHRWIVRTTLAGVAGAWETREDGKGRTAEVVNPKGQVFRWTYDLADRPQQLVRSNRTGTAYTYDPRDNLVRIGHWRRNLVEWIGTYTHDALGRVTGEDANGVVTTYQYDALGRLARETHPATGETAYQYDPNGNRTRVTRNGANEYYGYDPADCLKWTNTVQNRYPTMGQQWPYSMYRYDSAGQLVWRDRKTAGSRQTLDFLWDSAGRLREVKRVAGASVFQADYAGDGERVTKWDPVSGQHTYSFGLHDTRGNTLITPGLAEQSGTKAQVYHHDWRGSLRLLTDNTGARLAHSLRYDAYGQREGGAGAVNATDFQFAGAHGYQREPAAGDLDLDYLYQRYYDPAIGRFISPDPIGYEGGINLYEYCEGDPVNFVDPTGLDRDRLSGWEQGLVNGAGNLGTILGGVGGFFGGGGGGAIAGGGVLSIATAPAGAYLGAGAGAVAGNVGGRAVGYGLVYLGRSAAGLLATLSQSGTGGGGAGPCPTGGGGHWLSHHESPKGIGHTIIRHVGKTDAELLARLNGGGVSGASSFPDIGTAGRVISETIGAWRVEIAAWLRTAPPGSTKAWQYIGDSRTVIGRGVFKSGNGVVETLYNAKVVLRSTGRGRYQVLTSYPER